MSFCGLVADQIKRPAINGGIGRPSISGTVWADYNHLGSFVTGV
jgi:hypothetical protein